jgi:Transposase DDE domain
LVKLINKTLSSQSFIDKHKIGCKSFSRHRKLPFKIVFLFLCNILRSSYQNELDIFFKFIKKSLTPLRIVTKGAISLARRKLNYTAFVDLSRIIINNYYKVNKFKKWNNFRLLAIDGSIITLPINSNTINKFGFVITGNNSDKTKVFVSARISHCFDVLNHLVFDSGIEKLKIGERIMAAKHIELTNKNDLILADRGYQSFYLFKKMQRLGVNFCFRIKTTGTWSSAKSFFDSNKKDSIIIINHAAKTKIQCNNDGLDLKPMKIRLIKILLDNGQVEVLATSLLDKAKYKHSIFKGLYHLRWGIEESYKILKSRVEIENFSGKSSLAIKQDFYSKILIVNFTEILSKPAIAKIEKQNKKKEKKYKLNKTQALAKMKQFFLGLILLNNMEALLNEMINMIVKDKEILRTGRFFPRTNYQKKRKKYHFSYKPIS